MFPLLATKNLPDDVFTGKDIEPFLTQNQKPNKKTHDSQNPKKIY